MNVTREQLAEWTDRAQKVLHVAQGYCSTAEKSLQATAHQLSTHLPKKIESVDAKYDQVRNLHNLVASYTDFVSKKVRNEVIGGFEKKYASRIAPKLRQLDDIINELEAIEVPANLISTPQRKSLKDFIAIDDVTLLVRNINIFRDNTNKLHKLIEETLQGTVVEPFNNVLSKRFNKISKLQVDVLSYSLEFKPSNANTLVNTILKENSSLEQELVSLLEMLTKHYDQCVYGLEMLDKTGSNAHFDAEVLKNDSYEVEEVLKDLKSVYDIVLNNEKRSKKYVDSRLPTIDSLNTQIDDLTRIYGKFKSTNLFQLIILLSKAEGILAKSSLESEKDPLEAYAETVDQLIYHYSQFLSVFKTKYLVELHHEQFTYPRKFLSKLSQFLNEDLYSFQVEEKTRRRQWLAKYGDFIPKEFKLPGENDQPSVVQVITEGLEEIQESSQQLLHEEKELLNYIKHFRDPY